MPLDARPRITFGRSVHDRPRGREPVGRVPASAPEAGWEWIGDPSRNEGPARVRTSLTEVALQRWSGTRWEAVARKATTSDPTGVPHPLWLMGAGAAAAGGRRRTRTPPPTANVKLWLWSKSPFDFSRRTGGQWDEWFDRAYPDYPCIDLPPDREDCCDFAELSDGDVPAAPWHCIQHPDIELTWRVPPAPAVRVRAGQKELCFPKGADAEVQDARARQARAHLCAIRGRQGEDDLRRPARAPGRRRR